MFRSVPLKEFTKTGRTLPPAPTRKTSRAALAAPKNRLHGKKVVVTGKFETPRSHIEEELRSAGALVDLGDQFEGLSCSSAAEDAGSKLAKAKALKLPIWTEKKMRTALNAENVIESKSRGRQKDRCRGKTRWQFSKARSRRASERITRSSILRPSFDACFSDLAKRGAHFEILRYGPPASTSSLDKVRTQGIAWSAGSEPTRLLRRDGMVLQLLLLDRPLSPSSKRARTPKTETQETSHMGGNHSMRFSPLWKRIARVHQGLGGRGLSLPAPMVKKFVLGPHQYPRPQDNVQRPAWDDMLCLEEGE